MRRGGSQVASSHHPACYAGRPWSIRRLWRRKFWGFLYVACACRRVSGVRSPASWGPSSALQRAYPSSGRLPPPRLLRRHPSSGRRGGTTASLPSFSRRGGAKRRGGYTFKASPGTTGSAHEAQQQPFAPATAAPVAYGIDSRRSAPMEAASKSTTSGPQVQAPAQRRALRLGLLLPARAPRGGARRRGT